MAVDQVVRGMAHLVDHTTGEDLDPLGQLGNRQGIRGPCIDMHHSIPRVGVHLERLIRIGPPREDRGFDAAPDHRGRQLVDVDIHAAGRPHPRRVQRRRVHGQVGDAFDHGLLSRKYSGRALAPSRYL